MVVNRPGRVALFAGEGCLGIAVAASIATLNPNLNLPALPPEVNREIAARRYRPSSTAKKATDGTVGVRARCAVYSVWIAHPGNEKMLQIPKKTLRDTPSRPRSVVNSVWIAHLNRVHRFGWPPRSPQNRDYRFGWPQNGHLFVGSSKKRCAIRPIGREVL